MDFEIKIEEARNGYIITLPTEKILISGSLKDIIEIFRRTINREILEITRKVIEELRQTSESLKELTEDEKDAWENLMKEVRQSKHNFSLS